jgi:hypothetical protein
MMEVLPHDELTRLAVTLLAVRMMRRKLIHEGIHQSPLPTHLFITRFIAELDQVNEESTTSIFSGSERRRK